MVFVYEGKQYCRKRGSRREVLDELCYCTSGGLTAGDLEERDGKIISKKRSAAGKSRYAAKNPFKKESVVDEKSPPAEVAEEAIEPVEKTKPAPTRMVMVRRARKTARGGKRARKRRRGGV
jgi:hypothetical protein